MERSSPESKRVKKKEKKREREREKGSNKLNRPRLGDGAKTGKSQSKAEQKEKKWVRRQDRRVASGVFIVVTIME